MAEMKMEGIEYDQRMEELEKLEYPKPNRELVYSTFNAFADKHPWVGQENIRPKSIAREMFKSFRTFSDYIRDYELQRAEGVLLRYLSRAFTRSWPKPFLMRPRTTRSGEMETLSGLDDPQIDSSLLDEWEKMRDPKDYRSRRDQGNPPPPEPKPPTRMSPATRRPSPPPFATASSPFCAG